MTAISGKTQVLALFGDPVSHSLSPALHNGWIADFGLDAVYVAMRITGDAEQAFRTLKHVGLKGANVTVPHKEAAARAADVATTPVANVLHWRAGALEAFNTDGDGFLDAVSEAAPAWRDQVKTALVVGAGGSATALAGVLSGEPADRILVVNRTFEKAKALESLSPAITALPWEKLGDAFAEADLIVNATSIGLNGAAEIAWPVARCKPGALVMDIVYKPLETALLRAARGQGLIAIDGLGMLLHQGARAFAIWFGVQPDIAKGRARLREAIGAGA